MLDDDTLQPVARRAPRGDPSPVDAARLARQLTQQALTGGLLISRGSAADHIVDGLVTLAGDDDLAIRRACALVGHLARTSPPDDAVHAAHAVLRNVESRMAWAEDTANAS